MKQYQKYLNEVLQGKEFGGADAPIEDVLQDYDVSPDKIVKCSECGWKGKAKNLGMNKMQKIFCPECGTTMFG